METKAASTHTNSVTTSQSQVSISIERQDPFCDSTTTTTNHNNNSSKPCQETNNTNHQTSTIITSTYSQSTTTITDVVPLVATAGDTTNTCVSSITTAGVTQVVVDRKNELIMVASGANTTENNNSDGEEEYSRNMKIADNLSVTTTSSQQLDFVDDEDTDHCFVYERDGTPTLYVEEKKAQVVYGKQQQQQSTCTPDDEDEEEEILKEEYTTDEPITEFPLAVEQQHLLAITDATADIRDENQHQKQNLLAITDGTGVDENQQIQQYQEPAMEEQQDKNSGNIILHGHEGSVSMADEDRSVQVLTILLEDMEDEHPLNACSLSSTDTTSLPAVDEDFGLGGEVQPKLVEPNSPNTASSSTRKAATMSSSSQDATDNEQAAILLQTSCDDEEDDASVEIIVVETKSEVLADDHASVIDISHTDINDSVTGSCSVYSSASVRRALAVLGEKGVREGDFAISSKLDVMPDVRDESSNPAITASDPYSDRRESTVKSIRDKIERISGVNFNANDLSVDMERFYMNQRAQLEAYQRKRREALVLYHGAEDALGTGASCEIDLSPMPSPMSGARLAFEGKHFVGHVFAVHDRYGFLLKKVSSKQNGSPHYQVPGGRIMENDFAMVDRSCRDAREKFFLASRRAAARELFAETGIDVRAKLDRLIPANLRSDSFHKLAATAAVLDNQFQQSFHFSLFLTDHDFDEGGVASAFSKPDATRCDSDTATSWLVQDSDFVFEKDPVVAAKMLSKHDGFCIADALILSIGEDHSMYNDTLEGLKYRSMAKLVAANEQGVSDEDSFSTDPQLHPQTQTRSDDDSLRQLSTMPEVLRENTELCKSSRESGRTNSKMIGETKTEESSDDEETIKEVMSDLDSVLSDLESHIESLAEKKTEKKPEKKMCTGTKAKTQPQTRSQTPKTKKCAPPGASQSCSERKEDEDNLDRNCNHINFNRIEERLEGRRTIAGGDIYPATRWDQLRKNPTSRLKNKIVMSDLDEVEVVAVVLLSQRPEQFDSTLCILNNEKPSSFKGNGQPPHGKRVKFLLKQESQVGTGKVAAKSSKKVKDSGETKTACCWVCG